MAWLASRPESDRGKLPVALRPTLRATWAVACGGVAAGLLQRGPIDPFKMVAVWLLADIVLGCVADQLWALKGEALPQERAAESHPARRQGLLFWLAFGAGRYIARWRDVVWPYLGHHVVTALSVTGLALVLATYLGREMLGIVSLGLVALVWLAAMAGRDATAFARWLSGWHVTLAWLLGYGVLARWHAPVVGLALLAGLGTYARVGLQACPRPMALFFMGVVWAALGAALLVSRQPILAAGVAVAAVAGYMAGKDCLERPTGAWLGGWGWLITQLAAALAVVYWV